MKKKYFSLKNKFDRLKQKIKKISSERKSALAKHQKILNRNSLRMVIPLVSLIETNSNINDNTKTLCKMLIKKRKKKWDDKEKTLAQNIFYRSQTAYKFLRDGLQLNLPHVTTLFRWAPVKFFKLVL